MQIPKSWLQKQVVSEQACLVGGTSPAMRETTAINCKAIITIYYRVIQQKIWQSSCCPQFEDKPLRDHFYLKIQIPLGGHVALGFTLFITIEVDSPLDTMTENGSVIFLNWFFSLQPDSLTCLRQRNIYFGSTSISTRQGQVFFILTPTNPQPTSSNKLANTIYSYLVLTSREQLVSSPIIDDMACRRMALLCCFDKLTSSIVIRELLEQFTTNLDSPSGYFSVFIRRQQIPGTMFSNRASPRLQPCRYSISYTSYCGGLQSGSRRVLELPVELSFTRINLIFRQRVPSLRPPKLLFSLSFLSLDLLDVKRTRCSSNCLIQKSNHPSCLTSNFRKMAFLLLAGTLSRQQSEKQLCFYLLEAMKAEENRFKKSVWFIMKSLCRAILCLAGSYFELISLSRTLIDPLHRFIRVLRISTVNFLSSTRYFPEVYFRSRSSQPAELGISPDRYTQSVSLVLSTNFPKGTLSLQLSKKYSPSFCRLKYFQFELVKNQMKRNGGISLILQQLLFFFAQNLSRIICHACSMSIPQIGSMVSSQTGMKSSTTSVQKRPF